jgi:hypothetical protein
VNFKFLPLTLALLAAGASAGAQETTPGSPSADTSKIILAPKHASSKPAIPARSAAADRPASPAISADISAGLPFYSPELATPRLTLAPDQRELDKPRNQIPRLPAAMLMQKYEVHLRRIPEFRRRDLYTRSAMIELSFREHPGLLIGNLFNLNAKIAYGKIMDEELYADRAELTDDVFAMAAGGDAGEVQLMQQAILDESFEQAGPVDASAPADFTW